MEEQIKRAVRNLNISYVFFWVLPAFLLGAGEFDLLPVGALVDNVQATYYFETIGIGRSQARFSASFAQCR